MCIRDRFLVDILAIALRGVIDVWNSWKPVIEMIFAALQWLWDNILSPLVDFIVGVFSVSYTHLDVYKRQKLLSSNK